MEYDDKEYHKRVEVQDAKEKKFIWEHTKSILALVIVIATLLVVMCIVLVPVIRTGKLESNGFGVPFLCGICGMALNEYFRTNGKKNDTNGK